MAESNTRKSGGGARGTTGRPQAPRRDEENRAQTDWRSAFQQQISNLIGLALWSMLAQMFLGALVGVVAGILAGYKTYDVFKNIGLFDGIRILPAEMLQFMPYYFMLMYALGLMVAGMGIGLRHAIVAGNMAVARATFNSAIEHAIRAARADTHPRDAQPQAGLQAICFSDLEDSLRERVDIIAEHVEGYGIGRYFRRYVSTVTIDFIEEVARAAAKTFSENKETPMLNKDSIFKTRDAILRWIKKRAARNTFLITFTFVAMPIIAMFLMIALPAVISFLMHKI